MLARSVFAFAAVLAMVSAGCGTNDEVKKNEGTLVNTMPTGGATSSGGTPPAGGAVDPATKGAAAPPPAIPPVD